MASTLVANGEQVQIPESGITGAELKQKLGFSQDSSVVVPGEGGQNVFVADSQRIPEGAREVSIIPRFQYGG